MLVARRRQPPNAQQIIGKEVKQPQVAHTPIGAEGSPSLGGGIPAWRLLDLLVRLPLGRGRIRCVRVTSFGL